MPPLFTTPVIVMPLQAWTQKGHIPIEPHTLALPPMTSSKTGGMTGGMVDLSEENDAQSTWPLSRQS